jgi:hypothetical protein
VDLTQVDNVGDAAAQILDAARYIGERTNGRVAPFFAYPLGQNDESLVEKYFPGHGSRVGVEAAVTVDGRTLRTKDSIWTLPRLSCGYNWNSPAKLRELLRTA